LYGHEEKLASQETPVKQNAGERVVNPLKWVQGLGERVVERFLRGGTRNEFRHIFKYVVPFGDRRPSIRPRMVFRGLEKISATRASQLRGSLTRLQKFGDLRAWLVRGRIFG